MVTRHKLRIRVTDQPDPDALVSARTVTLRERLLARLLGRKQQVTVVVPGRQVSSIEVIEPRDDLTALADAVNDGGDVA
ncbi:hypothetical protein [Trueperella bialowiezensis]|uniref:Uncharacterized protein n=1 Tax=Trueperella bialowiezensis TaxID=312285 RepID=A0A448PG04_9ACTO|nr:hypothetical protein [Trueperella bialowiezensis]VEI13879.1 Uncharacterised protein [Trueperella bialowiezensis]